MPKILKNIWFWIAIIFICISTILATVFIFIPLAKGYTIGFIDGSQLSLENIYYIFAILGVFATLAAVGVAIYIPKQIADRQDKIALFKKRYTFLVNVKNAFSLSNTIIGKYKTTNSTIEYNFTSMELIRELAFMNHIIIFTYIDSNLPDILNAKQNEMELLYKKLDIELEAGLLLYDFDIETKNVLKSGIHLYLDLVRSIINAYYHDEDFREHKIYSKAVAIEEFLTRELIEQLTNATKL